jgi:hypothetical protein
MLLEGGESLVRSAYAIADTSTALGIAHGPGVLYLTNHRILFETPASRGAVRDFVGGRDVRMTLHAPLAELRNASVRRGRVVRPRLVLEFAAGHAAFDVLDPDDWVSQIATARREILPPGSAPAPPTIERQVVKVRCRFCGTLGREGEPRCPSCGAPL